MCWGQCRGAGQDRCDCSPASRLGPSPHSPWDSVLIHRKSKTTPTLWVLLMIIVLIMVDVYRVCILCLALGPVST